MYTLLPREPTEVQSSVARRPSLPLGVYTTDMEKGLGKLANWID